MMLLLVVAAPLVFSIPGILANDRNKPSILPDNQCCRIRSRIRSDPELLAGSGINHFGSESGQPLLGMNLKQTFTDKIHNFSTKCTIKINKNLISQKIPLKSLRYKNISATFSRWRPALPDPKQESDPESEPKLP